MAHNHEESHDHELPESKIIKKTLSAVVQIVALKKGFLGNSSSVWTGSGTIVDPRGIILTNCHVADPRSMGMPAPAANALGISITTRSDEPPALTYLAEIIVKSPELDLAVLRIVSEVNGKKIRGLSLPYIPVGDSDKLELADKLAIFGYPGIGGETVTFTSGGVAGFSPSKKYKIRRAWIKTDATIAGGNSGGTAVNHYGELVGIPTQAAAGDNISPVDARPVIDTNRDGRVDQRDSVMAIGGFINGLRPVNLAKPLLKKAGVKVGGAGSRTNVPMEAAPKRAATQKVASPASTGAAFNNLIFSSRLSRDRRPINPSAILPAGTKNLNVTFDYTGMRKGTKWSQVWTHNGKTVLNRNDKWSFASKGWQTLSLSNRRGLPDGQYEVNFAVRGKIVAQGSVSIGRAANDTDAQISGQIVNAKKRPIKDALVIALKPNVRVRDFAKLKSKSMAQTSARTDRSGNFTFGEQLPKNQAYGLVVVARGYTDLMVEKGLRVGPNTPEEAKMNPIALKKE